MLNFRGRTINSYFVGIYMCVIILTTFPEYFVRNSNVHQCNTRQADDLLVPFAGLNVRKFSKKKYMVLKYRTLYHSI